MALVVPRAWSGQRRRLRLGDRLARPRQRQRHSRRRPDAAAAADQQEKAAGGEDPARAAKVAAIVGECSDPATTPAELYLRNRGITAAPLPPSLRYRPNAHGRYGALVALATDASGTVNAVQQIYVTDDGRKAPVKVQKRTNKARDDWSDTSAVRLPGKPPIILCEGVENALSVWQATGQESWACLGIANIARAPVSEGAAVIVARDGDAPGSKAEIQLRHAVTILRQRGCQVAVAEPPTGKDFNDVLVEGGEDAVRALIAAAVNADLYSTEWRAGLLRNSEGAPRAILANAIHALRAGAGMAGCAVAQRVRHLHRRPPAAAMGVRHERLGGHAVVRPRRLPGRRVAAAAGHHGAGVDRRSGGRDGRPRPDVPSGARIPRRTALGRPPRLDTWLITLSRHRQHDYVRAVGARWLISAVARVFHPGAKADCALILEGPQGIKKSTALSVMAQPWFTDRLSDLGSKDAAMETKGVWIIEIAELDTMSRAEVSAIKAFMSRTHDRFRPPYGKRLVDLPRQCVFAGSINPEGGYLKDATGGRRFWPVVCGQIDIDALARDRDQLWAEARDRFRNGRAVVAGDAGAECLRLGGAGRSLSGRCLGRADPHLARERDRMDGERLRRPDAIPFSAFRAAYRRHRWRDPGEGARHRERPVDAGRSEPRRPLPHHHGVHSLQDAPTRRSTRMAVPAHRGRLEVIGSGPSMPLRSQYGPSSPSLVSHWNNGLGPSGPSGPSCFNINVRARPHACARTRAHNVCEVSGTTGTTGTRATKSIGWPLGLLGPYWDHPP